MKMKTSFGYKDFIILLEESEERYVAKFQEAILKCKAQMFDTFEELR